MGQFIEFDQPAVQPNVGPAPAPAPAPGPVVAPPGPGVQIPVPERKGMLRFLKDYQTLIAAVLVAGGLVFFKMYEPTNNPVTPDVVFNVAKESKAYGRELMVGYGDSCLQAAQDIRTGKSFGDAQANLKAAWKAKGEASFVQHFGAHLNTICPEGTEPNPTQREAMAKFLEDLGNGVKK